MSWGRAPKYCRGGKVGPSVLPLTHFCPPLRFRNQVPTFALRGTDVSRHNGGTSGAPLNPSETIVLFEVPHFRASSTKLPQKMGFGDHFWTWFIKGIRDQNKGFSPAFWWIAFWTRNGNENTELTDYSESKKTDSPSTYITDSADLRIDIRFLPN